MSASTNKTVICIQTAALKNCDNLNFYTTESKQGVQC